MRSKSKSFLEDYITNGTMKFKIIEITKVTGIFAKVIHDYRYIYGDNNQTSANIKLFGHAISH